MNEWQVLMAVETRYEEGPVPLSASRKAFMEAMDQLRHEAVALLGEGRDGVFFEGAESGAGGIELKVAGAEGEDRSKCGGDSGGMK